MLSFAVRAVCCCGWIGWLRLEPQEGVIAGSGPGSDPGASQAAVGSLRRVSSWTLTVSSLACPRCHETIAPQEPDTVSCAPDIDNLGLDENIEVLAPEPEPRLLSEEPIVSYFHEIWCPHCTHVDVLATLRPDAGLREMTCPKCRKSHQVFLNEGCGRRVG